MAAVVALSLSWLWWALLCAHTRGEAWGRKPPPGETATHDAVVDAEAIALVSAIWLVLVGIASTLLSLFGAFDGPRVAIATATIGALAWMSSRRSVERSVRRRPRLRLHGRSLLVAGLVVGGGLSLRLPPADYALAGRDQGTYTLQAQHALRTGGLGLVDPVLAAASREVETRPGPGDILGLYPIRGDAWAADRYEGAYRPGFYLADRERGRVVPQFLHLHPLLMATGGLVLGPSRVTWVVTLEAALALLCVWTVARRLLGSVPWALVCAGLVAASPLLCWVHRTALTEVLATVLLFGAVLCVLRSEEHGPGELARAGLLFGATAWLRGHAWVVAPVVAMLLLLVPPGDRATRRGSLVYVAIVVAGVLAHAASSWPYLHDELARQLPGDLHPSPGQIAIGAAGGLMVWWSIDERWGARRTSDRVARAGARLVARAPLVLGLGLVTVFGAWLVLRGGEATRPFSRLDPWIAVAGAPLSVLAALGLASLGRARLSLTAAHVWLVAIAASVLVTVGLYAQRNLPQLHLYYYGRYLAPEAWPIAALAATHAVRRIGVALARWRRAAFAVTVGLCGLLAWSVAGVLVVHPVTRLREFAGAEAAVDHIAAQLPEGAIVIAGGEGWHHGHTWNQIGGALALRTGVTVLPYRSREAAYATMHELLVERPRATGLPAPPVFLLLNEATKPYTRDGDVVAGIDDLLPPPFFATRIDLVELEVDRLTPTREALPTRVTRDGLRMGLFAVEVDPARRAAVKRHRLSVIEDRVVAEGGAVVRGGRPKKGRACLDPREPLRVELPPVAPGDAGPVSIVLVATPGTSSATPHWRVRIDGAAIDTEPPGAPARARDTLGPIVVARRPTEIEIRGSKRRHRGRACPHGGLAEVRVLGPDLPVLDRASKSVRGFGPPHDLGVPVRPASWVSARGLSRYRPGVSPPPEIRAVSMVLRPGTDLSFSPEWMPDGGRRPLDVIVTLARSRAGPDARLVVLLEGEPVLEVAPPATRDGSWQSSVATLPPPGPVARFGLRLVGDPDAQVFVRDIGLFSRAVPISPEPRRGGP